MSTKKMLVLSLAAYIAFAVVLAVALTSCAQHRDPMGEWTCRTDPDPQRCLEELDK